MDPSNLQAFNERLNQWIAQQGFWFQLRYSMSAGGGFSTLVYHSMRIAFRLFLVACLAAAGFGYFLVKRVEKPAFKTWMTRSFAQQMGASDARINRFRRTQGQLDIGRLACMGGPDAFFTKFDAANVRCRMGLLDGFAGVWHAGPLAARQLLIEVKAGADNADLANRAGKAFFREYSTFEFPSIESDDATVRWGYSARTFGSIKNSRLNAQRLDDAWHLQFRGGTFSQNWLEDLEIEELKAVCDASGLRIEKGIFHSKRKTTTSGESITEGIDKTGLNKGTVTFENVTVTAGEQPMVKGSMRFEHVALESLLPKRLQGLLEGTISGQFTIGGSLNSGEGMNFAGQVVLDGDDSIVLRDRLYLLRSLQVVDGGVNGFRKVVFREGSFGMKSGADVLELRQVDLKAGDAMTLNGALRVRPPTQAEVDEAVNQSRNDENLDPLFSKEGVAGVDEGEVTLKKAAEAANRKTTVNSDGEQDLFEQFNFLEKERAMQDRLAEMAQRTLRYEGGFRVTLPSSAFARAPELRSTYLPDPTTDRIALDVPIQGGIDEITLRQSEEIYEKGHRGE